MPSAPLKPVLIRKTLLPACLSLLISAGAVMAVPIRAETGILTSWLPSDQLRLPNCQALTGAVLALRRTVKLALAPGASVSWAGVTTVVKPGTAALAL